MHVIGHPCFIGLKMIYKFSLYSLVICKMEYVLTNGMLIFSIYGIIAVSDEMDYHSSS